MGLRLQVNGKNLTLHYLTVVGSTLHGLADENSDVDCKGVFTWDQDVVNGLVPAPEQLDNKNMKKEDRAELMAQLNKMFDYEFDEDLDLFEGRKFFKNAMKSEPNMLDMLYADTVDFGDNELTRPVFYSSDAFEKVLDNRALFVNMSQAKQRFLGMSFNTFKLGKKEGGRSKDLAKSLQTLLSFQNLVKDGEYNPRLNEAQLVMVHSVKFAEKTDSLVETTDNLRKGLEEDCNNLELPEYKDSFEVLNNLLLNLHK